MHQLQQPQPFQRAGNICVTAIRSTQRRSCLRHTSTTADIAAWVFACSSIWRACSASACGESRFVINSSKPGVPAAAGQLDIFSGISHTRTGRTASVGDFKSLRHDARQLCQRLHLEEAVFGTVSGSLTHPPLERIGAGDRGVPRDLATTGTESNNTVRRASDQVSGAAGPEVAIQTPVCRWERITDCRRAAPCSCRHNDTPHHRRYNAS